MHQSQCLVVCCLHKWNNREQVSQNPTMLSWAQVSISTISVWTTLFVYNTKSKHSETMKSTHVVAVQVTYTSWYVSLRLSNPNSWFSISDLSFDASSSKSELLCCMPLGSPHDHCRRAKWYWKLSHKKKINCIWQKKHKRLASLFICSTHRRRRDNVGSEKLLNQKEQHILVFIKQIGPNIEPWNVNKSFGHPLINDYQRQ